MSQDDTQPEDSSADPSEGLPAWVPRSRPEDPTEPLDSTESIEADQFRDAAEPPAVPDSSATQAFPPPAPLDAADGPSFEPEAPGPAWQAPQQSDPPAAPSPPQFDPPPAPAPPQFDPPPAPAPPQFDPLPAPTPPAPAAPPAPPQFDPPAPSPAAAPPPSFTPPPAPPAPAYQPPPSPAAPAPGAYQQAPDYSAAPPPGNVPGQGAPPPQPPGAAYPGQGFGAAPPSSPAYAPPPSQASGGRGKKVGIIAGVLALLAAGGAALYFGLNGDSDNVEAADSTSTTVATNESTDPEQTTTSLSGPLGAEELAHSVVQIQLLLDGQPTCTGSGTIVDPDGTVVTNFHVVEQSPFCPHDQIGVAIAESSQVAPTLSYEADLLAFDIDLDLAVVRIARSLDGLPVTEEFAPLNVGDSDAVGLGDQIRVIGFPGIGGDTVTFTTGSVSGFTNTPEGDERTWMKTDATITGGNSGGLAADTEGNFIGIPTRVGTGDGQIVDCRVITDSNGDGNLDGDDSCVPIGGFINGIRPVALAIPLIEESRTASPIDQGPPQREEPMARDLPEASNPTWSSGVTEDGEAIDSLVAAVAGQGELCVTWDYENVPVGIPTDAIWLIDGETIPEASVLGAENSGDTFGSFFACITNDAGLEPGVYELAWIIEEELVFAEAIIVGDGATATIDVENITEVPLCVVQFNPTGTATYGLNELSEELLPGDVVTIEVAVGPVDARVIDCDGSIRIEDATGFEVSEDLILSVD